MIFASPAEHVRLLLRKMDEHLYNHFEVHGMGDMLFVHRYMYKYWPPWIVITTLRCEDEGEYEIWLNVFSPILKVKTSSPRKRLVKEITRSPDGKMIKLLTFDILFLPPRPSR